MCDHFEEVWKLVRMLRDNPRNTKAQAYHELEVEY